MKISVSFVSALILASVTAFAQSKLPALTSPPEQATLFGEGSVSTGINERDFAISPDGNEIYYTISTPRSTMQTIVYMKKSAKGDWSAPEVAPFAGEFSDLEPAFSADGNTLYFASNRPLTGTERKDFDIWKVTRTGTTWGKPENLGSNVNTTGDEFYPSITRSGNLYYTAQYAGGPGREDIYVSSQSGGQFQKPVALDTAVNSKAYEFNAFVDPNEQYILFTSYGRKDDSGGGDLYMAVKDTNGKWRPAQNLKELNSKLIDYCPFVSPDGKAMFFTSERHQLPVQSPGSKITVQKIREIALSPLNSTGNIYWVSFATVYKLFK